ncbi:alpha/beta hydrolase [Haliea sp. E17]|uniref:alpha/beta hydrolase n=1 Tax=Haliea sp. E17 TaxID=3401576 RepID=UPI003AABEBF3
MSPADLADLRKQLPTFSDGAHPGAALLEFCRFYGIEFSAHFPEASYRAGLVDSGPFRIMLHRWLQPAARASLLLVHGYYDHCGLYGKLIAYGLSRGYNVLIFDLPGHGLSSGEPAVIDDFGDYAQALRDALAAAGLADAQPLYALGQSTGCAVLTECARQQYWPFARTAYLAPLVRPARWRLVQLGYHMLSPFTDSLARKFNRNSSDEDFLAFIRRDPLQCQRVPLRWIAALQRWLQRLPGGDLGAGPLLLVQGREDGTVDWRYNIPRLLRLFAGSEVFYLPAAGHQLANEAADLRELYYAALDQWFARDQRLREQAGG